MKKIFILFATVILMIMFAVSASAETEGYYTYMIKNGEAIITDVDTSISGDVTIPSTLGGSVVTTIGNSAFKDCIKLTSITIHNRIATIGYWAFDGCTGLISIIVPDNVTSIGYSAFRGCETLASITLPFIGEALNSTNNTSFGYVFGDVPTSLREVIITAPCKTIEDAAFYYCTSLTNIEIPDSVTSIGHSAFYGCTNLTNITIPDSVTTIDHLAFRDCTNLTSITIPESVTFIGYWTFYGCTNLASITLPFVGETPNGTNNTSFRYIFGDVPTSLREVIITAPCKTIDNSAFSYCKSLSKVIISDSVTSIGFGAFLACEDLTDITIPNSVTSIEGASFSGCKKLTTITISNSLTHIGNSAFANCSNLTDVYYYGTKEQWNNTTIDYGNNHLTNATIHFCCSVNSNRMHSYNTITIDPTCTDRGHKIYTCPCGDSYTETLPAKGHTFSGSVCTTCGYDKADTCSCNCHKSGLSVLLWKLLNFFYKLLRMNETCACGVAHY